MSWSIVSKAIDKSKVSAVGSPHHKERWVSLLIFIYLVIFINILYSVQIYMKIGANGQVGFY